MKIRKSYLPLFRNIDQSVRKLPMLTAKENSPGPTIWLTAAIHGDEINGTAVIHELFKRFKTQPIKRGTIYSFPILNPSGFEAISRYELYEKEDLNRHFDGSDRGSVAERQANLILSTILETKPDYVIDLHTDSTNSIAYTIVDAPKELIEEKTLLLSIALAKKLGLLWAIDTEKNAGYSLEKCLTGRLVIEGVPAVTMELGGPLVIEETFKNQGTEAVWKVLTSLGIVSDNQEPIIETYPDKVFIFQERITTPKTGIIEYFVKPGQNVKKGTMLGKIRNVFGETIEIIYSPTKATVFSHEDQSIAFPGQILFTLAVESGYNFQKLTSV